MSDLYWDPVPDIDRLAGPPNSDGSGGMLTAASMIFGGRWDDRNWRNVPGPIYGAMTDNCWVGRVHAPHHVLYGDDIEYEQEFLFRQPKNVSQLQLVLDAAYRDPFGGWASDGDEHWTPARVSQWWADRDRLTAWIDAKHEQWTKPSATSEELEATLGLREYLDYLHNGLYRDLCLYSYWLANRRSPQENDSLPAL